MYVSTRSYNEWSINTYKTNANPRVCGNSLLFWKSLKKCVSLGMRFFCIFTLLDDGDYCMTQPDVDEYGLLQYQSCISNEIIGSNCSSGWYLFCTMSLCCLFSLRVNLTITNNPKGGLFRPFWRPFTWCTSSTPSLNLVKNHRKILAFRAQSVFAVKMAR